MEPVHQEIWSAESKASFPGVLQTSWPGKAVPPTVSAFGSKVCGPFATWGGRYHTVQMRGFQHSSPPSPHTSRHMLCGDPLNFVNCLLLSPVPGVSRSHTSSFLELNSPSQKNVEHTKNSQKLRWKVAGKLLFLGGREGGGEGGGGAK